MPDERWIDGQRILPGSIPLDRVQGLIAPPSAWKPTSPPKPGDTPVVPMPKISPDILPPVEVAPGDVAPVDPVTPTSVTATGLVQSAVVSWQCADTQWLAFEVYAGDAPGFVCDTEAFSNRVAVVRGLVVSVRQEPATTMYYRVISVNSAGERSAPSQAAAATTSPLDIADTSLVAGSIAAERIAAGTLDVGVQINAQSIVAGTLTAIDIEGVNITGSQLAGVDITLEDETSGTMTRIDSSGSVKWLDTTTEQPSEIAAMSSSVSVDGGLRTNALTISTSLGDELDPMDIDAGAGLVVMARSSETEGEAICGLHAGRISSEDDVSTDLYVTSEGGVHITGYHLYQQSGYGNHELLTVSGEGSLLPGLRVVHDGEAHRTSIADFLSGNVRFLRSSSLQNDLVLSCPGASWKSVVGGTLNYIEVPSSNVTLICSCVGRASIAGAWRVAVYADNGATYVNSVTLGGSCPADIGISIHGIIGGLSAYSGLRVILQFYNPGTTTNVTFRGGYNSLFVEAVPTRLIGDWSYL